MKDSKLFKNSSFSVLQTIVIAAAALLLFKLMVVHAGLKATGLWSYLSSVNAIAGFGSFGFANALLYHIPKYQVQHDENKLSALINTTFLSVLGFTTVLCLLSYAIFSFVIPLTVEKDLIGEAYKLLPLVVLSFFFSGLSTTYLSVLDGLMLMHVRAKITIAGSVIFFVTGYFLLQKIGIAGIPLAQLIQNIFLLIVAYLWVKRKMLSYRFSLGFSTSIFKNIFRYGFNFQVMSVTQIISDPFMKSMITKYAGSNYTAMFDFCVKLLSVFRSLIIAANQSIVPQITVFNTIGRQNRIITFYKANFRLVLVAGIILFLSPVVMADAISTIFLNHANSDFNFILYNVSLGLLVNAISFPAYFYYMGTGNLKWNVINNIITAVIILIFTPLIGEFLGGKYLVVCWSASAAIGASVVITAIHKQNSFSIRPFFNKNIALLLLAIFCAAVLNHYLNQLTVIKNAPLLLVASNVVSLSLFLLYPVLSNPVFKKIRNRVRIRYAK